MTIPTNQEIENLLDRLNTETADDLETQWLEFKPWTDPKKDMKEAVEYAVCFANTDGGALVFGVTDRVRGRDKAIHGAQGYDLDVWRKSIYDGIRPNLPVEVSEINVPEGTRKLLVVRVPKGYSPTAYGTAQGLYKKRVGKNCMPLDPQSFSRHKITSGAVDWSGHAATGVKKEDLDPLEIARARSILRSKNPESELLKSSDDEFLKGLEAIRNNQVTNTGLLLFGKPEVLTDTCPQNQVHYVHQTSDIKVARNDIWRVGLLQILEKIDAVFMSPSNPEEELSIGLFKLRIPSFPTSVVREAVLNALTHRDYSDPGEVLIRHTPHELVFLSPGGFVGGITVTNILRHEPVPRNRTLANAFLKLRLVESAGTGRRRIFIPMLSYGKRPPVFESDGHRVTLRLYDGTIDKAMATLVARWNDAGREIDLDALMVLTYLKAHPFIDSSKAESLLQLERDHARDVLDRLSNTQTGVLERKGGTRAATFYLTKGIAKDLLGEIAYTKTRGLNPTRYAEIVREYLKNSKSITNKKCRDLLNLGDSASAQVEASRYLKKWSGSDGFLIGSNKGPGRRYRLRKES
jgi:ATP-dependent DNA helicase RecG